MTLKTSRFSGDDIITFLWGLFFLSLLIWLFVVFFSPSCIPGEHFLVELWYWPSDEIYCPCCGDLLHSVPRCVCGNICRNDFCAYCGLEQ